MTVPAVKSQLQSRWLTVRSKTLAQQTNRQWQSRHYKTNLSSNNLADYSLLSNTQYGYKNHQHASLSKEVWLALVGLDLSLHGFTGFDFIRLHGNRHIQYCHTMEALYYVTATEAPNHNTVLAVDSGHGCCCYLYAGPETLPPFILTVYRLVHTLLGWLSSQFQSTNEQWESLLLDLHSHECRDQGNIQSVQYEIWSYTVCNIRQWQWPSMLPMQVDFCDTHNLSSGFLVVWRADRYVGTMWEVVHVSTYFTQLAWLCMFLLLTGKQYSA